MNRKRLGLLVLLIGLALVLAACGGGEEEAPADEPDTPAEDQTEAPAEEPAGDADTEEGAEAGESTLVAEGEEAYQSSCISCHGGNLEGGAGPALTGLTLSKDEIVDVIVNGRGTMPGNLAPGKEEAIAEYLLSQQ